jgi:hypothetical protein
MALPGHVLLDISRWKRRVSGLRPNRSCTSATTASAVLRCGPSNGSRPLSKSPIISNMNGPNRELPFCPAALAGARFQLRPVQTNPSGSMVTCWAMSLHPLTSVWWRHIATIDS